MAASKSKAAQISCRFGQTQDHAVIHVEAKLEQPASLQAKLELWRTTKPDKGGMFELVGNVSLETAADTVFPAETNQITWCHFNPSSLYPIVLKQEHLESVLEKYPDPLLHRCFGAALTGPDLVSRDDHTFKSSVPAKHLRLDLTALTTTSVDSPQIWQTDLEVLLKTFHHENLKAERAASQKWWRDFWNRSWIHVSGTPDAVKVSQGYAMQLYDGGFFTWGVAGEIQWWFVHYPS
jgi:alpha-L-fucosidase 2